MLLRDAAHNDYGQLKKIPNSPAQPDQPEEAAVRKEDVSVGFFFSLVRRRCVCVCSLSVLCSKRVRVCVCVFYNPIAALCVCGSRRCDGGRVFTFAYATTASFAVRIFLSSVSAQLS